MLAKVAVVGTGRVGLPFAAVSSKYHDTVAVDSSAETVRRINDRVHFSEPLVDDYLKEYGLRASTHLSVIRDRDLIFVCVGSQAPGLGYSATNLISALRDLAPFLTSRKQTLVIMTTVPLTSFEKELGPYLSSSGVSDKILGFCYNPSMMALGNAIHDFEKPNYLLVGESNPGAGEKVQEFWREIVGSKIPLFRSSLANIELAKYALNSALTLKIAILSLLTEMSEKVGADIDFLSEVLKSDPRIAGTKMFKGGMGYGGTCFPVDAEAFRTECEKFAIPADLARAIESVNSRQVDRTIETIESFGKKRIAILGVTYKPNTSIVAASQSLQVAEGLAKDGYEVMVCDPEGLEGARQSLGRKAAYTNDANKALAFGDVIFLGVEWDEFRKLEPKAFRKDQIVVDPWRMLKSLPLECKYVPYGTKR